MAINLNPVFNASYYRGLYPDLAEFNDTQAFEHWQTYGIDENRKFSPLIDLDYYRNVNPDLQQFDHHQLLSHLLNFGMGEGRSFSPVVDLSFYIGKNSDLSNLSFEQAFQHLQTSGIDENRRFSPVLDLDYYRTANPDLQELDNRELLSHLITSGLGQGRTFSPVVDISFYISVNPDLSDFSLPQAFGHLVAFGINEGRMASPNVDLNYYRSIYADISDFTEGQAFRHLVAFGIDESRIYWPETNGNLPEIEGGGVDPETASLPGDGVSVGLEGGGAEELDPVSGNINSQSEITATEADEEEIWWSIPALVDPTTFPVGSNTSIPDLSWGQDPYIVWRNYETGENQAWFMDGTEKIDSASLPSMSDLTWRLMGSANFDGDESPDLVWRNSETGENQIWLMKETEEDGITEREVIELPGRDPNWQLRGIGDIDGDGNADIFWHHLYSGQNEVWLMNDTQRTFTLDLPSMYDDDYMVDTDWDLRGTGDFNNDNRPDLLWRNTVTGANQIWLMSGLEQTETVNLPAQTDVNWLLMGTDDLNGDGSSDLLWHNINTQDNQVWLMDGTTQDEVVDLPNSEGWEMVFSNFLQGNPVEGEVPEEEQQPPVNLISELNHVANLATSVGDGGLSITVEASGSFGSSVNPLTDAYYDPVGSIHEASTAFQSRVAIRIGETGERTFLTQENTQVTAASNQSDFTATSPNSIYSEFTHAGLEFNLEQSVGKLFQDNQRTGSFLTQTYTITNPGSEPVNFDLVRYLDGDLQFDGSIQDGGGRLVRDEQQILFETDAGGDPLNSTTFVGITADGGTELEGNFEIDDWWDLEERVLDGAALANAIAGDGDDDDEFVDANGEYDLALALGNGFELAPGESTTYTTTTIFGSGSPETSLTEDDGSLVIQLADTETEETQAETDSELPLTGSANSDVLTGTDGDDVLSGVDADAEIPGLGEIDTLTGGAGSDVFGLGDSAGFYYNDGDDAETGASDYGLITDFNASEDFIQLYGEPTDYQLGNVPAGLPEGTAIFKTTADRDELIGVVQGIDNLTIDSNAFSFV